MVTASAVGPSVQLVPHKDVIDVLRRQKVVLNVLDKAKQPLSPIRFVKFLFLLREESPFRDDSAFYDFVPYRYGPFSFALYRELNTLRRDGYVSDSPNKISLASRTRAAAREKASELSVSQRETIAEVVLDNLRTPREKLLRRVYHRFPWYALMTEFPHLAPEDAPQRPRADVAVYTVGYQGRSVDGFFNHLLASGISAIIDVRANPVSRKYGFAKKSMSEIANKLRIGYHHLPELGIESGHRANLGDFESYQRLLDSYEADMLPERGPAIERAIDLLRRGPSTFLCMERDASWCHRGRLAKVAAENANLPVIHL
jgi:uncharacterized protein (DUF488 family)